MFTTYRDACVAVIRNGQRDDCKARPDLVCCVYDQKKSYFDRYAIDSLDVFWSWFLSTLPDNAREDDVALFLPED